MTIDFVASKTYSTLTLGGVDAGHGHDKIAGLEDGELLVPAEDDEPRGLGVGELDLYAEGGVSPGYVEVVVYHLLLLPLDQGRHSVGRINSSNLGRYEMGKKHMA